MQPVPDSEVLHGLEKALQRGVGLAKAERGAVVAALEAEDGTMPILASVNLDPAQAWSQSWLSRTTIQKVIEEKASVDIPMTGLAGADRSISLIIHDPRAVLATPIVVADSVWGVMYLDSLPGSFRIKHLRLLEDLSAQVGASLSRWLGGARWQDVD